MKPILVDDRLDLGQFGDLMDQRFGVVAGELITTTTAGGRLAVDRLANLLGRNYGAVGLTMSMLSAALFPTGRSRRFALQPNGIGRGGFGGVSGVELEPVLKILDPVLELRDAFFIELDKGENRRLKLRRSRLP
jgi:hypothetical protein